MSSDLSPRPASQSEVDGLSSALAAAFEDDPVFTWLIPNRSGRLGRLRRFFRLELRHVVLPVGCAWTADGTEGASLELPPGAWKMPLSTQVKHGREFVRVFGARLPHAAALITLMEHHHLREPHFYIPYVGVAPPQQGKGFGTLLLRATLERCDRAGLPAYLEATSERNARLYARLRFEHGDELTLGSSPPLWLMRRPPVKR